MLFQTQQVLEITDLSHDTLRVWKRKLKPINGVDGRQTQYTFAQLLGLCLIQIAVKRLGIPISKFEDFSEELFLKLQDCIDEDKIEDVLCVKPEGIYVLKEVPTADSVYAIVQIKPVLDKIQTEVLNSKQLTLPLIQT